MAALNPTSYKSTNPAITAAAPQSAHADCVSTTATASISQLPKITSEKALKSIVKILRLYDPTISQETIAFLPVSRVVYLAKVTLLHVPSKKSSGNAIEALFEFFNHKCHLTNKPADIRDAYTKYWACLGNAELEKEYGEILFELLNYELYGTFPKVEAGIAVRQSALQFTVRLMQKQSVSFVTLWEETITKLAESFQKESTAAIKKGKINKAQLKKPENREIAKSIILKSSLIEENALTNLPKLKSYSGWLLPKLTNVCSSLNVNVPNFHAQVDTLHHLMLNCIERVTEITKPLMDQYVKCESALSICNGTTVISEQARVYTIDFTRRATMCQAKMLETFVCLIPKDWTARKDLKESLSKIPSDEMVMYLASLADNIAKCLQKIVAEMKFSIPKEIDSVLRTGFKQGEEKYFNELVKLRMEIQADQKKVETFIADHLICLAKDLQKTILSFDDNRLTGFDILLKFITHMTQEASALSKDAESEEKLQASLESERKVVLNEIEKQGLRTLLPIQRELNDLARYSVIIARNQVILSSIDFHSQLFLVLNSLRESIKEEQQRENTVKADIALRYLELEEMEIAAKKAKERALLLQKEQAATSTATTHSKPIKKAVLVRKAAFAYAPKPATIVATPTNPIKFKFAATQLLFEVRQAIAESYEMDPAAFVAPEEASGSYSPTSELAKLHHLKALDDFRTAIEMLLECTRPEDEALKPFLMQLVLKTGHAVLEQCITTEYAKLYPDSLSHQLQLLLQGIEVYLKNNLWTEEASDYDMQHRYPFHYAPSQSFGLKQLQTPEKVAANTFYEELSRWIQDSLKIQIEVLKKQKKDNPQIKRIEQLLEAFLKSKPVIASAEVDLKEAHSKANEEVLRIWERKLGTALNALNNRFKAKPKLEEVAENALKNARHHLIKLLFCLLALKRFPQQRYMHLIFNMLHSSARDFSENLGETISSHITHSLDKYRKEYGLGKKLQKHLQKLLKEMDVHKGIEYPFTWFEDHGKEASSMMNESSKLAKFSFEAVVLGEKAMPAAATAKKKKAKDPKEDLVKHAISFAELVCELTKEHLT